MIIYLLPDGEFEVVHRRRTLEPGYDVRGRWVPFEGEDALITHVTVTGSATSRPDAGTRDAGLDDAGP